jgi:RNA polymerase sigma factor for flagellar operon FliA
LAAHRDVRVVALLPLADEPGLWQKTRAGEPRARESLIEAYLPYARMLAAKLFAGRIDSDQEFAEYLQFATVGLIESVDRFDPERATLFTTFANRRIQGAVLNGMEHLSEKRAQLSARRSLRADRIDSVKGALSEPELDLFAQLAEIGIGLALGHLLDEAGDDLENDDAALQKNHYAALELRQLQDRVRAIVENLPPRERLVIKYHYLNQVPFSLIAETLGLTRGRVSQIHRHALTLLHKAVRSIRSHDAAW